jgi:hypothetical protein
MTVDPPDHDRWLRGHPAVELDGSVHAFSRRYPGPDETAKTECGIELAAWSDISFRGEHDDGSLCPDCWPQEIRP